MENNELCNSIGNAIMNSNNKYEGIQKNMFLLFINVRHLSNKDILQMFTVSFVPYCILLKEGHILQKLYGSNLMFFLHNLDECTSTIYNTDSINIHNTLMYTNEQKNKILQNYNPTFSREYLPNDEDYIDTKTFINQIDEKLERLVKSVPVMIFIKGTPNEPKCRYSRRLVELLRENHVRFGFFNVLKDQFIKEEIKRFTDWPTFPQVFLNGEFQGGLDIIVENLKDDPMFFQKKL